MPSTKRGADDGSESPHKIARTDTDPQQQQPQLQLQVHQTGYGLGEYGSSKKKSGGGGGGGSTRTGQACDRCKVRKIRCDARPGGCSPCLQNNSECKTTDRITGRATSRGHTEVVESENTSLKMYILELQQQLKEHGLDAKPPQGGLPQGFLPANAHDAMPSYWLQEQQQQQQQQPQAQNQQQTGWESQPTSAYLSPTSERQTSQGAGGSLLPDFRSGCIGDNYLGVGSESNWLSPIEGTSLALFGTKIDLAEFMPAETDSMTSAMSYRTFISHAFGRTQPFTPTMPPYEQCKVYAEWYFRTAQAFCPILHKPDFMNLLDRIHHQDYQPNSAEAVMVHMVLAIIYFQFSLRNANEQARQDSMSHYHYALSFIPDLITGHKLEDLQALTLICAQLRNQPRPAAAWMFTNFVMGLAIESGLHRSAKAWQTSSTDHNPHHFEMRKRTFWTLLLFHIALSGKLGRPMPFRPEDFDIEIPEALNDTVPDDGTSTKWRECSFTAAIEAHKICVIQMRIYSTIYAVKSTGQYEANVRKLDKELESFQAQLPAQFCGGAQTKEEDRVYAQYIEMAICECYLLVHHPSLCRSAASQMMQSNLDVCLLYSGRLLTAATILKDLKCLDTTWYSTTNYIAAIFTTLFAHTERRDQITSAELQKLRQDMDAWMEVMKEISLLLGTLPQLLISVRQVMDFSLGNITRHLAAKTASAAVHASSASPTQPQQQQQAQQPPHQHQQSQQQPHQQSYGNGYNNGYANGNGSESHGQGYTQQNNSYPNSTAFNYPDTQNNGLAYATGNHFDTAAYSTEHGDNKPNMDSHNTQPIHMGQSNFMAAFAQPHGSGYTSPPATVSMNGSAGGVFPLAGPAAWRSFADNMMMNVHQEQPHDYSASMMSLGGTSRATAGIDMVAATIGGMHMPTSRETDYHAQMWPLIQFGGLGQ